MKTIREKLKKASNASAWERGVRKYAIELIEMLEQENWVPTEKNMLCGAEDWASFSFGGNSLIYDEDIAERLCTASFFKKKKGGNLPPNVAEEWLDVQARALECASRLIVELNNDTDSTAKITHVNLFFEELLAEERKLNE